MCHVYAVWREAGCWCERDTRETPEDLRTDRVPSFDHLKGEDVSLEPVHTHITQTHTHTHTYLNTHRHTHTHNPHLLLYHLFWTAVVKSPKTININENKNQLKEKDEIKNKKTNIT